MSININKFTFVEISYPKLSTFREIFQTLAFHCVYGFTIILMHIVEISADFKSNMPYKRFFKIKLQKLQGQPSNYRTLYFNNAFIQKNSEMASRGWGRLRVLDPPSFKPVASILWISIRRQTDRPTDRPTDGPTDGPTDRPTDGQPGI